MEHLHKEMLELYINNELDVTQQERVETHIYCCDDCLDVYFELIENLTLTNTVSDGFTEQIVSKIDSQNNFHQKSAIPYQSKNNKIITHYFLAAGLTIVLMLSGVFQGVLDITNDQNEETRMSVTNQLMEKTNYLLDQIKGEHK